MTKKDYVLIAKTLKRSQFPNNTYYISIVDDFATALKVENPRFDRNKFLTACGIED